MKISKNEFLLAISFFLVYFAFSVPMGYMQTYLNYLGYDAMERGLIFTISAITTIVFQFVAGFLCDYFKSDKKVFNIFMILATITVYITFSYTNEMFYLHLLFVSLVNGVCRSLFVIQDTWCLETDETCKAHFGPLRSLGAIGWMAGTTVVSVLISNYGYDILGLAFCVMSIINIVCAMLMQDAVKIESNVNEKIKLGDLKILFKNKKYVLVICIFLVINIIATADQYTVIDKMMMLGASETLVGQRWTIQAFTELPLFLAGAWLIRRFGDYKLMVFGTMIFIVKFIAYALAPTPEMMIVACCLQGLSYPLTMITSKTLVDENTPKELRASGQTVASSIYVGLALLITPIFASFLSGAVGIDTTLFIFALSGLFSLYFAYLYKKV